VGGYGKFGMNAYVERTVTGLPPHYQARVRFLLLKIDSWDAEDFYITIDTTRIKTERINWDSDTTLTGNLCGGKISGSDYNEAERTFSEVFSHSASTLKVKLHSNLNAVSTDESWGFSNFELVVYRCDATCASCTGSAANQCTGCNTNAALSSGVCSCNTG
jgi:proprotein convertase subtilisin/kexin type 5